MSTRRHSGNGIVADQHLDDASGGGWGKGRVRKDLIGCQRRDKIMHASGDNVPHRTRVMGGTNYTETARVGKTAMSGKLLVVVVVVVVAAERSMGIVDAKQDAMIRITHQISFLGCRINTHSARGRGKAKVNTGNGNGVGRGDSIRIESDQPAHRKVKELLVKRLEGGLSRRRMTTHDNICG